MWVDCSKQTACIAFAVLAFLQAQAYSTYQAMIIPQSKVDLTQPVNEFAHKVLPSPHPSRHSTAYLLSLLLP